MSPARPTLVAKIRHLLPVLIKARLGNYLAPILTQFNCIGRLWSSSNFGARMARYRRAHRNNVIGVQVRKIRYAKGIDPRNVCGTMFLQRLGHLTIHAVENRSPITPRHGLGVVGHRKILERSPRRTLPAKNAFAENGTLNLLFVIIPPAGFTPPAPSPPLAPSSPPAPPAPAPLKSLGT